MASNRRVPDVGDFSEDGITDAVATQSVNIAECWLRRVGSWLPSARPEIFSNSDRVVPPPRPVRPEISSPQIPVPRPETIEEKVLSHPRFETFSEVYSRAPRVLYADPIK